MLSGAKNSDGALNMSIGGQRSSGEGNKDVDKHRSSQVAMLNAPGGIKVVDIRRQVVDDDANQLRFKKLISSDDDLFVNPNSSNAERQSDFRSAVVTRRFAPKGAYDEAEKLKPKHENGAIDSLLNVADDFGGTPLQRQKVVQPRDDKP